VHEQLSRGTALRGFAFLRQPLGSDAGLRFHSENAAQARDPSIARRPKPIPVLRISAKTGLIAHATVEFFYSTEGTTQ
jgi:hypothetical protein